jgi:hypothetical protein
MHSVNNPNDSLIIVNHEVWSGQSNNEHQCGLCDGILLFHGSIYQVKVGLKLGFTLEQFN